MAEGITIGWGARQIDPGKRLEARQSKIQNLRQNVTKQMFLEKLHIFAATFGWKSCVSSHFFVFSNPV